nr:16S rRNA (cytosine(1402)-N(4))-methyltransferase RsmH [Coxiella endosymbiont of Amblyomma americanum]
MYHHRPVLLNEVTAALFIHRNGLYVDATFGRGGHSFNVLKRLGLKGHLLAMDKDPTAIVSAINTNFFFRDERFTIVHESFSNLEKVIRNYGWHGKVDGIILDLGVSSPQLDDPRRGFGFMKDGPLDMRMNEKQKMSATTWLNQAKKKDIRYVLWHYGEERYARRIAEAIIEARKKKYITRTLQLSDIIVKAVPCYEIKKHPATRTFQAIRIFINRELDELSKCLPQCLQVLAIHGRLCVISFHSLEDRIVKYFIQQESSDSLPRELPILGHEIKQRIRIVGKLIKPTKIEISKNPRARSARLRVVEKLV